MASSPCRTICVYDAGARLCSGCGRTLEEIAAWGALGEAARLAIMAQLPGRLVRPADTAATAPTSPRPVIRG